MFAKDSREENFLTQFGPPWKYSNRITWNMLAKNWDAVNWGRSKVKIDEAILEYATLMEAGSPAPAPILWARESGHDVLDGLQRLGAERLMGSTQFSAYVIQTDSPQLARAIRVFANLRLQGGHQDGAQWTLRQAVQVLVIEEGMSIEEVARMGGWKKEAVEREKTVCTWGFAIRKIGGPANQDNWKGVILNLAEHAKLKDLELAQKPIGVFLNELKRAKFTNGQTQPYIQAFFGNLNRKKPKGMHRQCERRLEKFLEDPEVQARLTDRGTSPRKPEIQLRSQLKTCETVAAKFAKNPRIQIRYVDEYFHILGQIERHLHTIGNRSKKLQCS